MSEMDAAYEMMRLIPGLEIGMGQPQAQLLIIKYELEMIKEMRALRDEIVTRIKVIPE